MSVIASQTKRAVTGHEKIRVLIADDHALMRAGAATVIDQQPDMMVVAQAGDGNSAFQLYARHLPDVAVVDLRMPGMDGVELIEAIRRQFPAARLIILTIYDSDDDIDRGLRAGAKAFLLKDMSAAELAEAIREVHHGKTIVAPAVATRLAERMTQTPLTAREMSVLRQVVHGKANKEIAAELFISEGTVKVHLTHLFEKLGVASRTEAMALAVRRGLARLD
ncbi:MAG: two-component response regulator [Phycisphaerales bacterium]|jgi:two-component system NarL family response regulator|nr:two-component response regulator [Phycisphaerales bacterium]